MTQTAKTRITQHEAYAKTDYERIWDFLSYNPERSERLDRESVLQRALGLASRNTFPPETIAIVLEDMFTTYAIQND